MTILNFFVIFFNRFLCKREHEKPQKISKLSSVGPSSKNISSFLNIYILDRI